MHTHPGMFESRAARRPWLAGLSAGLILAAVTGTTRAEPPPNVLLILVDDLKPALGAYGDRHASTPALDAFAATALRCDLAYCNQAVCAASRYSLMLGSRPTSTGLYGLHRPLRAVLPDAVTLPQWFARHGWRCESLGKVFHVGHGNRGDDASFSIPPFVDKVVEYVDPANPHRGRLTREEALFTNAKVPGGAAALPRGMAFEAPDVADEAYADGRVAAEAARRLAAAAERRRTEHTPFFMAVGFARPHLPFCAPRRYWDRHDPDRLPQPTLHDHPRESPVAAHKRGGEIAAYEPVPEGDVAPFDPALVRRLVHGYYAATSYVDAQIGRVLGALDDCGLRDDTIVVVWGDHGFHLGDHGIWTKHTNYEQAARIPLLIRAPGVTQAGSATAQPVETVDLFPTLGELAGLPRADVPQPLDGRSLVPVFRDPAARIRDHAYHAYDRGKVVGRAVRTDRYRLVEWKAPDADPATAEFELYDYRDDPAETVNLAAERPRVVAELMRILATHPEAVPP